MRPMRAASTRVETIMRTLALIAVLGLLALALVPIGSEDGDAKADSLQWQASWD